MKTNEYKCAVCKGIFTKELTDKEAIKQLEIEFPGFKPEDCDVCCDDCFKKMQKAGVFNDN